MKLVDLIIWACNKSLFNRIGDYADFCEEYLAFASSGLQAVIVSQNEQQYQFYQYKEDGRYNITRPINSTLMFPAESFGAAKSDFLYALSHVRDIKEDARSRAVINRFVYTCQQALGATLDALPAGESNTARKINGDLFERFVRTIIAYIGVSVREGTVSVPVIVDGKTLFSMSYQHDLIVEKEGTLGAIGSVKTSSKDRIDKIFIDKFLYNRLTNIDTPHFAVFLNDVQRKGREPNYGVNTTFLTGHFKGYTIKLNPLDGVYYCDIRPIMQTDEILKTHIKTFDSLLVNDIWDFIAE